jgi:chemotaxis protein methyltransferase CheR
MNATSDVTYSTPELKEREYTLLSRLVYECSGINLGEQKQPLLRARLAKRLRALGLKTFKQYYFHLTQCDPDGSELTHMLDAVSTNLTEFFREPAHFDYLKKTFFPRWKDQSVIRILSAGCSTGEEPYSIAISAHEYFGVGSKKVQIVGGDVCTRALAKARAGIYSATRVASLPRERMHTFFLRGVGSNNGLVAVTPEIRQSVEFIQLNLAESLTFDAPFHAIFCRNVAIYFDKQTQTRVFQSLGQLLVSGGNLFVGHAESLISSTNNYVYVQPAVYQRP